VVPSSAGNVYMFVCIMTLCLMAASYPVYRVVALWFDRALSTAEATIYVTLLVFLIVGIMATLGSPLGFLLIVTLLVSCAGVPLLNRLADNISLRRMEDHDVTEFTMTLAQQPGNKYARERLARIYWKRKQYDEALGEVAAVLKDAPKH